jgi:hypothetical protein
MVGLGQIVDCIHGRKLHSIAELVGELTIELTLTILLGEPRRREGISNIAINAGARWFTCMCCS